MNEVTVRVVGKRQKVLAWDRVWESGQTFTLPTGEVTWRFLDHFLGPVVELVDAEPVRDATGAIVGVRRKRTGIALKASGTPPEAPLRRRSDPSRRSQHSGSRADRANGEATT